MDIQTAKVYENEIAKAEDFDFGFNSLITNSKIADSAINRCEHDYICGGALYIGDDGMSVGVRKIWGNSVDGNILLPLHSAGDIPAVMVIPPASGTRIDIIEAQGVMKDIDEQQRAFKSSSGSDALVYQTVATKSFLAINIQIKTGELGTGVAPLTDTGYIKLGEIEVNGGTEALVPENLRGVTAEHDGDVNTLWTAEQDKTFYLGSLEEIVQSYLAEHWRNGKHKDAVIKQNNIDFGSAALPGKVSAATIPIGKDLTVTPSVSVLKTDTIFNALEAIIANASHPVGSEYWQSPSVLDNDYDIAFPQELRPAHLWGGTWVPKWENDQVFLRTGGTLAADAGRTNGLQGDAIRNITGWINDAPLTALGGAFAASQITSITVGVGASVSSKFTFFDFKASRVVPTAGENRPINIRMIIWKRVA
ncbi:MAG: hypothetical protein Ta2A_11070 [Treponemataceae bacterium]|nr:MAG: hypothetical protein Ta2A_11070 [Treponemataceae bacterium]